MTASKVDKNTTYSADQIKLLHYLDACCGSTNLSTVQTNITKKTLARRRSNASGRRFSAFIITTIRRSVYFRFRVLLAHVTNFRLFEPLGAQRPANHLLRGNTVKHLPLGVGATTETKVGSRRSFWLNIVVIDPDGGRAQETSTKQLPPGHSLQ